MVTLIYFGFVFSYKINEIINNTDQLNMEQSIGTAIPKTIFKTKRLNHIFGWAAYLKSIYLFLCSCFGPILAEGIFVDK